MQESQVVFALSALAQTDRLRIARFLVRKGPDGAAAGAISKALSIAPSRLSFHLSALEKGGLVHRTRVSQSQIYRLNFVAMAELNAFLSAECCTDFSGECAPCAPSDPLALDRAATAR